MTCPSWIDIFKVLKQHLVDCSLNIDSMHIWVVILLHLSGYNLLKIATPGTVDIDSML